MVLTGNGPWASAHVCVSVYSYRLHTSFVRSFVGGATKNVPMHSIILLLGYSIPLHSAAVCLLTISYALNAY